MYFATRNTKINDKNESINSAVYVLSSEPKRYAELLRPKAEPITIKTRPIPLFPGTDAGFDNGYAAFGVDENVSDSLDDIDWSADTTALASPVESEKQADSDMMDMSPFDINENIIYDPPHVSPRIRAQDGVLLACHQPMNQLEEKDYIEIVITHQAHDDIRQRLDLFGVFDKQLFPDLDGIAKWLKYRVFEIDGKL